MAKARPHRQRQPRRLAAEEHGAAARPQLAGGRADVPQRLAHQRGLLRRRRGRLGEGKHLAVQRGHARRGRRAAACGPARRLRHRSALAAAPLQPFRARARPQRRARAVPAGGGRPCAVRLAQRHRTRVRRKGYAAGLCMLRGLWRPRRLRRGRARLYVCICWHGRAGQHIHAAGAGARAVLEHGQEPRGGAGRRAGPCCGKRGHAGVQTLKSGHAQLVHGRRCRIGRTPRPFCRARRRHGCASLTAGRCPLGLLRSAARIASPRSRCSRLLVLGARAWLLTHALGRQQISAVRHLK